jgi:twitching motility two-component system response regulator PilH
MRKKLLIADDNRAITEVLKLNFDLLGYEVQVAADGDEAEVKCKDFKPDVMILDVMMPKKNGYKVCRDLKNDPETSGTPIILLTAKNLKEDVYWGYDSGADAYITKPYDPRQLEILVDQLIKEKDTGQRNTAWTGLPSSERVIAENTARIEAGAPSTLLELSLEQGGMDAFGAKYGKPRLKDLIHRSAWQIYEILKDATSAGVVGQSPEDRFLITLLPEEVEGLKAQVEEKLGDIIRGSYDASDLKRGELILVDPDGGQEKRAKIITLLWKVRS